MSHGQCPRTSRSCRQPKQTQGGRPRPEVRTRVSRLIIGLFAVAFLFVASGMRFYPLLLYAADLYWLNLYLVCLTRYGRTISG